MAVNKKYLGFVAILVLVIAALFGGLIRTGAKDLAAVEKLIGGPRDFVIADVTPSPSRGQISFVNKCDPVISKAEDPIVFPERPGLSHIHDFMGNPAAADANTTLAEMAETKTLCRISDDRSGYWVPAAYQNGRKLQVTENLIYYKGTSFEKSLDEVQPIPFGLHMIVGDAKATKNQNSKVGWWQAPDGSCVDCVSSTNTKTSKSMVSSKGNGLQLRLNFPNCWNGTDLDSEDHQSHVAYANGQGECPSTHPVKMLQLVWFVHYKTASGGSNFSLSSGPWYTFHADFVNLWEPDTMDALLEKCIHQKNRCRNVFSDNAQNMFWGDADKFNSFWKKADYQHGNSSPVGSPTPVPTPTTSASTTTPPTTAGAPSNPATTETPITETPDSSELNRVEGETAKKTSGKVFKPELAQASENRILRMQNTAKAELALWGSHTGDLTFTYRFRGKCAGKATLKIAEGTAEVGSLPVSNDWAESKISVDKATSLSLSLSSPESCTDAKFEVDKVEAPKK